MDSNSYYFSRYPMIWGWATWRRAWQRHDPDMRDWPAARASGWLQDILDDPATANYWTYIFDATFRQRHTWDYGWVFSCWQHAGLSIHPRVNLVRNAGFGYGATHTQNSDSRLARLEIGALDWPLRHPATVAREEAADDCLDRLEHGGQLARVLAEARGRVQQRRAARPPA